MGKPYKGYEKRTSVILILIYLRRICVASHIIFNVLSDLSFGYDLGKGISGICGVPLFRSLTAMFMHGESRRC